MQTANVNIPLRVTGRHVAVTEAIRTYVATRLAHVHLDYPRIIEAHAILDIEKHRQQCELVLHCADHITIDATAELDDLYAAIDATVAKVAQQMRKHKTRHLRRERTPGRPLAGARAEMPEAAWAQEFLPRREVRPAQEESAVPPELKLAPAAIATERLPLKTMLVDEALLQLELGTRSFVIFRSEETQQVTVLHRQDDGTFGLIEPCSLQDEG